VVPGHSITLATEHVLVRIEGIDHHCVAAGGSSHLVALRKRAVISRIVEWLSPNVKHGPETKAADAGRGAPGTYDSSLSSVSSLSDAELMQ
jgi:hypothetical protein